jgi:hypothetical protein
MTAAEATGEPSLRSFVTGLRADQDAVTNGLGLRWSSGSVEGHVNRIKMLKRQMYGRAALTCSVAVSCSPTSCVQDTPRKVCQSTKFQAPLTSREDGRSLA